MLGWVLRGRSCECAKLDELLASARGGRSAALVLRGEAGIGKTAVIDRVAAAADDLHVLRTEGVEAEMELPFAALHQLCAPLLDHVDALPGTPAGRVADGVRARFRVARLSWRPCREPRPAPSLETV
jgi:hypothetical protein